MKGKDLRRDAAADVVEIEQLVLSEREAISHSWWSQAADCYEEGAHIHFVDFEGPARDYLDHRRRESALGRAVRWRLYAPVVHMNLERAVATVEAVVSQLVGDGREQVELDTTLVFRVRRRHLAWLVVGIDGFVHKGTLTTPAEDGAGSASSGVDVATQLTREALRALGDEMMVDEGPASSSRYEKLLAWAGLAPGLEVKD